MRLSPPASIPVVVLIVIVAGNGVGQSEEAPPVVDVTWVVPVCAGAVKT